MSAVKDPPREAPYNATMRLHDWSCLPQYSRAVQHDMGPNFRVPATAPDMYQTCSGGPVAGGGSAMSLTVRLREGSVFRIRGIKRKLVLPVAMPTRTVHFWCFSPKTCSSANCSSRPFSPALCAGRLHLGCCWPSVLAYRGSESRWGGTQQ